MRIRMSMVMVNGRKVCFIVMIRTKVPEYIAKLKRDGG